MLTIRYHCKRDFKGLLEVKLSQEPQWSGCTTTTRFLPLNLFVISWELVHLVTCSEHHYLKIKDLINGCKDWLLFFSIVCKDKRNRLDFVQEMMQ
jgi:hypothetical protein